jgi:hypothetical protein
MYRRGGNRSDRASPSRWELVAALTGMNHDDAANEPALHVRYG